MANKKITELTELNATPANDDELVIVDTDAAATKRISVNNLMAAATDADTTNATDPIYTTAGDIVQGTGSATAARLGIGSAGDVLTVNSGATAVEWAASSGGGGARTISAKTSNYTLTSSDLGKVITVDSTGGSVEITVPNTSTLTAGFYCYVVEIDSDHSMGYSTSIKQDTSVNVNARQFASGSNIYLKGPGAMAHIQNYATDKYSVDGDVGPVYGFASLVCDSSGHGAKWVNFDDSSENVYGGSTADWGNTNYGRITGTQLSGNYKLWNEGSYDTSSIDSALSGTGSSQASIESSGYVDPNIGGSYYPAWFYCGTGDSVTSVDVDSNGTTVTVLPFLHKMNTTSNSSYAWNFGLYYVTGGNVAEALTTGNSGDYFTVAAFGDQYGMGSGGSELDVSFIGVYESSYGGSPTMDYGKPEYGGSASTNTPRGKFFW